MIEITALVESDVGRAVVYTPAAGPREDGTISSWSDEWVFVRYGKSRTASATDPRDLDFLPSLSPR